MSNNIGSIVFGPSVRDAFKDFEKFYVGFDDEWNRLVRAHNDLAKNIPNYPPYNIRKVDEDHYAIELAVAGFARTEIDIILEGDKLTVKGSAQNDTDSESYLFKGIGMRDFVRTFALNDHVEVQGAELLNGMLKIFLERIIPESKKPKKIEISDNSIEAAPALPKKGKKQLLTEAE